MDRLKYEHSDLEEAIKFFQNEINQYEIAMGGVLREEYRNYLVQKTRHYKIAIDAIKEFFQVETKEV